MKNFLGIGTWNLKGLECENSIFQALKSGYRVIDTASIYNNEINVGRAIKKSAIKRSEIIIISKINTFDYSIEDSINKSLDDLNTQYIDIMLIHWPIFKTSLEDYIDRLMNFKKNNKIKHIGVSNFNSYLIKKLRSYCRTEDLFNQIEYHPYINQDKLLKNMEINQIHPIAYCPLCRGNINKDKSLKELSKKYNKTISQITLRWLYQKGISSVPKSSNLNNIESNIDIFNFSISSQDIEIINELKYKNIRNVKNISKYKWD